MNTRRKKTLIALVSAVLTVPLYVAPLPFSFSGYTVFAAVNESPAPSDDPLRAKLLYEISVFKEAAEMMTPSALHGNLPDLFEQTYKNRIVAETTAIAQNPGSTPKQLQKALDYVDFSLHDFFDKGDPYTGYILIKMSGYFNLHFPRSDEPGGYSDEKVQALVQKLDNLRERLDAGEDEFTVYRTFIETLLDFYAHPNV
ncbi:hypothetical protein [Saccharibacillus sacchari]|uniref:Uncharacterized protein n=1 Tax=Saccharibacillus sacchari TaxID=456493 RepID=A0ACC6PEM1_9BACL